MKKLALVVAFLMVSCAGSGPLVDVCLSYPVQNGFVCVDVNQKAYFVKYVDSAKFVAFNPSDAQKLIDSCGLSGHAQQLVQKYFTNVQQQADKFVRNP